MRWLIILVVLVVIGAGVVEWSNASWEQPGTSPNPTVVLIPPHSRTHDIVRMLERRGVTHFGLMFEANLRARGLAGRVKAGEYAIPAHASMAQIAAILVEGKSIQHKLTAAEGLTSAMIWKLVRDDSALTGDAGPVPAEGTLLPETYLFTRGETRAALIAKMERAQQEFLRKQWDARAPGLPFKSMQEAVILASVVEKETALPEERRHVAGLFVNRLKVGMKLQSDPTIIYGLTRGYPLGRGIRASEIAADTPYNTYVIGGLPVGPICNPGKDSIAAVLNPEPTDDLFFVATGHGGHVFAASMSAHLHNVAAYRAFEHQQQREVQDNGRAGNAEFTLLPVTPPELPAAPRPVKRKAHR
jgi:UPF0755 protein